MTRLRKQVERDNKYIIFFQRKMDDGEKLRSENKSRNRIEILGEGKNMEQDTENSSGQGSVEETGWPVLTLTSLVQYLLMTIKHSLRDRGGERSWNKEEEREKRHIR